MDRGTTVRRVGLLADLGLGLMELGRSSRLLLAGNGQSVLSLHHDRGFVTVAVVQDGRGGRAYLWGASERYAAGAGAGELQRAASAPAGIVR
ncbi:hypothetical protein GCM10010182_12080 [Actinomadura cremea]|nr:hypothetical protein GCM10010182_12080 [Actinomadura cremea]